MVYVKFLELELIGVFLNKVGMFVNWLNVMIVI